MDVLDHPTGSRPVDLRPTPWPLRQGHLVCALWAIAVVLLLGGCTASFAPPPSVPQADLPRLLADVSLAQGTFTLVDVVVDHAGGRIYVGDSAGALYILDADTLDLLDTRADAGGFLTLDTTTGRLYAATGWNEIGGSDAARVVVLDTASGAELARFPGRWVSLDTADGRIFAGDGFLYDTPQDAPGIRILDASTFSLLGEIPQPGIPLFNPVRGDLLIVAYTLYVADPDTQTVTRDLFPFLTDGIPFRFCNGCAWADSARIFPEAGLVAVDIQGHSPQGSGPIAPPTWLDAYTLDVVEEVDVPELQATCGSGGVLVGARDGRFYRSRRYLRYVVFNNLLVEAVDGTQLAWRDGIFADLVNSATGQAYLSDGQVLALPELVPVGTWPVGCIFVHDRARDRIYAGDGGVLRVIAARGGVPARLPPTPSDLPAAPILAIVVSPNYAEDPTLLVRSSEGRVYRSTDGGATWMHLRGGLPSHADLTLGILFSPNYAADDTLFAYGYRRDYWGEGVMRSTDGGDTWTRLWGGMTHLRVAELALSPAFTKDATMVATGAYAPVQGGLPGRSLQLSTDGGATWTIVATADSGADLPSLEWFMPAAERPSLPVRAGQFDQGLEYMADGETWLPAAFALEPGDRVVAIAAAPAEMTRVYVLTGRGLYRTTDGGRTWQAWNAAHLGDRTYADELSALAVVPAPTGHSLLVGTMAGEFWMLNPTIMIWSATNPAPLATATPTPAPVPPLPPLSTPPLHEQEPPADRYRPQDVFANLWAGDTSVQMLLGWALTPNAVPVRAATQPFERGEMIWRGDLGRIYARFDAMGWQEYADSFAADDPAGDLGLTPPPGLVQPNRGFGKAWREQPGLRELIGWARAPEQGWDALVQEFERGFMLRVGERTLVVGTTLDGTRGWVAR